MRYIAHIDDEKIDVTDRVCDKEAEWNATDPSMVPWRPDQATNPTEWTLNDMSTTTPWNEDDCISREISSDGEEEMFMHRYPDAQPITIEHDTKETGH